MPNELELTYQGSDTLYAIIRRQSDSKVWSVAAGAFATWADNDIGDYDIALTDKGGDVYQGAWPSTMSAGRCRVLYYRQGGAAPATDDLLLSTADLFWDGTTTSAPEGVTLDTYALTALAKVKRYMRIDDSADDTLLTELINQVSDRIERLCYRQFKLRTYCQRERVFDRNRVLLRHYPVVTVNRIGWGRANALSVSYAAGGSPLRATIQSNADGMQLDSTDSAGATTTTNLDYDTYPTTASLAAAIGAVSGWSATAQVNVPSVELNVVGAVDALDQTAWLTWPDQAIDASRVRFDSGVIELKQTPSTADVFVAYQAGYATIPDDVELVTHELVAEAFNLGKRDTTAKTEWLGDYSFALADAVAISAAQLVRLRPYMSTPSIAS